jgi:hypothetical protein
VGYIYCLISGFFIGAVVAYLYAKAVIVKVVNAEKKAVALSEAEFHNVLTKIKEAL